jgi:sugar phosphate isomerase/epimerase
VKLKTLRSMWGAPPEMSEMLAQTTAAGFDGIEGPPPVDAAERQRFSDALRADGLVYIAEATTGLRPGNVNDWWVPDATLTVDDHLADLRSIAQRALELGPLFVSTMCGYDAWSWQQNVDFFGRALDIERELGLAISFETHRCRSMFNPWVTRDLLTLYPTMKVTCDFSHWCVVCERLVDTEIEIVRLVAERALHVQCRVGWAQGAQVNDPAAPEHRGALEAHERWWDLVWASHRQRGMALTTMTPEFGPDGYTQLLPHTRQPVVDLWSVTRWMKDRQRKRFAEWAE